MKLWTTTHSKTVSKRPVRVKLTPSHLVKMWLTLKKWKKKDIQNKLPHSPEVRNRQVYLQITKRFTLNIYSILDWKQGCQFPLHRVSCEWTFDGRVLTYWLTTHTWNNLKIFMLNFFWEENIGKLLWIHSFHGVDNIIWYTNNSAFPDKPTNISYLFIGGCWRGRVFV